MRNTAIVLISMALMIAGCGDKDDAVTETAAEPETAVIVEEAEVVVEPAADAALEAVEEVVEEKTD
ncbi:MAG: hypothetical protein ABFS22_06780 [Pseudomonadota bacterium]